MSVKNACRIVIQLDIYEVRKILGTIRYFEKHYHKHL